MPSTSAGQLLAVANLNSKRVMHNDAAWQVKVHTAVGVPGEWLVPISLVWHYHAIRAKRTWVIARPLRYPTSLP